MAVEIDPKALEALLEDLDRGVVGVGLHEDNDTELFDVDGATETMFEAAQLIRALRPSPSSDERVKVRDLIWGTTSYGAPEAASIVGMYRVVDAVSNGWSVTAGGLHSRVLQTSDGRLNFATVDDAKAAAQADYETRILSALDLPGDERVDLRDSVIEDRDARQQQVADWCTAAFGAEHQASVPQRGLRFLEEAIEAFQAIGGDPAQAHKLIDYIFAKEPGELFQELGGVGVTLLALGAAAKLSVDKAERTEIARVLSKPLEHFWARNKVKNDAGFDALAYPSGGALQPHKGE
jgi:hypothetical protein